MPLEINLSLSLPRDSETVPVVRQMCSYALAGLGVEDDCVNDVEVALSEACANVVRHSAEDDDYHVDCTINGEYCVLRVIDAGRGFDAASLGRADADPNAEQGRGIQLMRALVDNIAFVSEPESGTIVHLAKRLIFDDDRRPRFLAG